LATLFSMVGDRSLDEALQDVQGGRIKFQWQASFLEALTTYYDWRLEPGVEQYIGRCPSCLRRLLYRHTEEEQSLQIERRPGYRS